ncbi:hypothetical protein BJ085DRAFT_37225 [Dimargaris cristalligena]|uniref:Uncharacterized protein n=1 Tax=Dimargaris cristalligena TaxID=215637 RepID=A0A4Q0A506_9FUNG|nr:hypothetical protein BJ085DRAFT_37225 [Dimargaris cristalligena]|eukprot:RKP40330.1 hypothetical protein BJ085DRAFT_37225 [Dimargaris cristalligena]
MHYSNVGPTTSFATPRRGSLNKSFLSINTDPHPPRPETTAADSTTTFPSHSYLLPGSDPPSIAPSTSATYIQASTFPWQSASQTPLAAGPATTTAAETLGPNGSGSTPFRPWGTEFVRSLPTDIDFDQLEMLEADYRAMMTYSSRSMLALSQGKSTSEVQMELLKSLARFDADESRSP